MTQQWGRSEAAGAWLNPKPAWTIATLAIALTSTVAIAGVRYAVVWTPLQRAYLSAYVRSGVMDALGFTKTGRYRLLQVVDGSGHRLALEEELESVASPAGELAFALTDAARRLGDRDVIWETGTYPHAKFHAFLAHWVYRDHGLTDLVIPAGRGGLVILLVGLLLAIPQDLARARDRRHGRRLKGPELVTAAAFNRLTRADGVGFAQQPRRCRRTPRLRIARQLESSHVLIMGDSGTGKSALIRQILHQLSERGETAIVYDPALEYTAQFYTPDRGDVILNPLDTRCPYWSPADEVRHEAEALTVATSLFPDRHHDNPFFTEAPRRLFAHLLTLKLTPEELTWCLCHPDDLDGRVRGTAYAPMIDRQAPTQRSGVLASLNMVADALQLLPSERETTSRWSASAWSSTRRGWLFLTSTPETRPRLVPLTSLWLDTLVLRLMNQGQPHPRPTWFVLDELASLQRLPQLHTAITENRKSHNPVVLGFQGRSQLETRYGHDAEAMLSQPATKIFLRTSEPHAAKWVADTIGDIEVERLHESRSQGRGDRHDYGLERHVEPLVMASEISGLGDLRGYLKQGNLVVRLSVPFLTLPKTAPALIERPPKRPLPHTATVPTSATNPVAGALPNALESETLQRQQPGHSQDRLFG